MDPLKGKTLNVSAYVYAYNNPVRYIDPDGRFATRIGAWLDRRKNGESGRIIKNKHGQYSYEKSDGTGSNFSRIAVYGKNGYKGKQSSSNNESSSGGSRQKAGYIFFGLNSSQQMDWIKADVIYGMIDASGFLYPFSNPDSKAKFIFDAAKKAQFIMEYDFETAFKAGVEMDLPEMEDEIFLIKNYCITNMGGSGFFDENGKFYPNDTIHPSYRGDTVAFVSVFKIKRNEYKKKIELFTPARYKK